jgi:hypothetical protein
MCTVTDIKCFCVLISNFSCNDQEIEWISFVLGTHVKPYYPPTYGRPVGSPGGGGQTLGGERTCIQFSLYNKPNLLEVTYQQRSEY